MAMTLQKSRLRLTQAIYFGAPQANVGVGFVRTNGTTPMTADWPAGAFKITSKAFALPTAAPGTLTSLISQPYSTTSGIMAGVIVPANGFSAGNVFGGLAGNTTLTGSAPGDFKAQENVGFGPTALQSLTTGQGNTAFGWDAAFGCTTADQNTAFGDNALGFLSTGQANTAVGWNSLAQIPSGGFNTAVGHQSLASASPFSQTTAVGYRAGFVNRADSIVAVGYKALAANTTGTNNVAVGTVALTSNTIGVSNTGIGTDALVANVTGGTNTAVGSIALASCVNGSGNIAVGQAAGLYETGTNSFYINNTDRVNITGDRTLSLLYGTMAATAANQQLTVNGEFIVQSQGANPWTTDGWSRSIEIVSGSVFKWKKGTTYAYGMGQTNDTLHFLSSTADTGAGTPSYIMSFLNQFVGVNTTVPTRALDLNGVQRFRGQGAPAVSEANSGTIYFDSGTNKLMASLNGSAYVPVIGSGGVTGSGTTRQVAYWNTPTDLASPSGIYIDAINNRMGINVPAPTSSLDIDGDINIGIANYIRGGTTPIFASNGATGNVFAGGGFPVAPGLNTTSVGWSSLVAVTGISNTSVGAGALFNTTSGAFNTAIGVGAGQVNVTGSNNTFLGNAANASAGNLTGATAIGNGATVAVNNGFILGGASALVGIRTGGTPNTALDVGGQVSHRMGTVALLTTAGLNSNIATPDASYVRLTGATGGFSIGGFTGGFDGNLLTIYNTAAQQMTIVNEDVSSTAVNRIKTLTGGNVVLRAGTSSATFVYDTTDDRWILTAQN